MDVDILNAHLCAALGITDLDTLLDVVLEINPTQPPRLTIRRIVTSADGMKSARDMIGLTTTTANINATNFVAH